MIFDVTDKIRCFLNPVTRELGRRFRCAVIVCPGGGYSVINEQESDAVALRFMAHGMQSFVLRYTVGKGCLSESINELANTIYLIREKAYDWDIDPDRIVICGFSAGGHLGMMTAIKETSNKPNALICCYPVVSAIPTLRHDESIMNCLYGGSFSENDVSIEKNITDLFPPTFVWHCADDSEVKALNSLLLMEALARNGITYEGHIWASGGHGISLADETTARIESQINSECAKWFDLSLEWLRKVL